MKFSIKHSVFVIAVAITGMFLTREIAIVHANNDHSNGNIRICHATGSNNNPYVNQSPNKNGTVDGHAGKSHQNGNDIIPSFTYWSHEKIGTELVCPDGYDEYGDPTQCRRWNWIKFKWEYKKKVLEDKYEWVQKTFDGQNWNAEGKAIYNNNCNLVKPSPTPSASPSPTPTMIPSPSPSPSPTPTPTVEPSPTPPIENKLVIENVCSTKGKNVYTVTNTNDHVKYFNVEVNGDEVISDYAVPANSTIEITVMPYGVTEFIYKINSSDEIHEVVKDSGKICEEPTPSPSPSPTPTIVPSPTPNPCNTDERRLIVVETPCPSPSPTPSATPSPKPSEKPEASPRPVTNDFDVSFQCSTNTWNTSLRLKKDKKPVSNAKVDYVYAGSTHTQYTNDDGHSNYSFSDAGKGVLKVYIDSFSGHEVTLEKPACTPSENGDPQSATARRGQVLGASTEPLTYAQTGTAKEQALFYISLVSSALVFAWYYRKHNA